MQIFWPKIKEIIEETSEVKTYLLELPEGFTWDEGAHTHLALKGFNEGEKPNRSLIRHMSISTLPNENMIGITTRIKEQCSVFKETLRNHQVGDEVAIFKTHSNVPLRREGKNVYLLSAGVGLATFRPLVLEYLENAENIQQIHSLNVDSSKDYLFPTIFTANPDKKLISEFVDNRQTYYEEVEKLAQDQDGLFYVVGSDEFLVQNIEILRNAGIQPAQIALDKRQGQLADFFPTEETLS